MKFWCFHKRITWPITLKGVTHVVCLDCERQYRYSMREMRIITAREVRRRARRIAAAA